jgi:uncharacterized protein (UPF0261 family)
VGAPVMSNPTVGMIGTLDTKGPEFAYLEGELRRCGLSPLMVDISCRADVPEAEPAFRCTEVARRAGWAFGDVARFDKRAAGQIMVTGARIILEELYATGAVDGLIALGGANGTLMACQIMQAFPIGFPKVMVSVVAACDPRQNVGTTDIVLINTVTDLCLNQLTKQIFSNASAALAGMLRQAKPSAEARAKRQVGATMLGLTQGCVLQAQAALEAEGAELLIFHTNGIGGAALEDLVSKGMVDLVLDLTTNEVGNHLLGGVFDSGPQRMQAAAAAGIPQVVAPGATDFINFWGSSVPDRFRDRRFIFHNVQNTLMRTTPEENLRIGRAFADKLNQSQEKVVALVPLRGFSGNDRAGGPEAVTLDGKPAGPWHDPEADRAFLEGLRSANPALVDIWELDAHINEPAFAQAVLHAYHACASNS